MRLGGRSFFLVAAAIALLVFPSAYLLMAERPSAAADPVQLLTEYLKAVYARDFGQAYRFISSADRKLKEERTYIRERGPFSGFTLQAAKKLAGFIEAEVMEKTIVENKATVKLRLKLPDAQRLPSAILDWDEERLNGLSAGEQREVIEKLARWRREGRLPTIEGEETFNLVKEERGWRIYLNWAEGVRVTFHAQVRDSIPLEIKWDQEETLIRPGELFSIHFRIKNRSSQEVFTRIPHHVEPQAMKEYLELVDCGLFSPMRLLPREQQEFSSTYLVRGDLPEGVRRLAVTYEFKPEER